jgi:hypothetical protein
MRSIIAAISGGIGSLIGIIVAHQLGIHWEDIKANPKGLAVLAVVVGALPGLAAGALLGGIIGLLTGRATGGVGSSAARLRAGLWAGAVGGFFAGGLAALWQSYLWNTIAGIVLGPVIRWCLVIIAGYPATLRIPRIAQSSDR